MTTYTGILFDGGIHRVAAPYPVDIDDRLERVYEGAARLGGKPSSGTRSSAPPRANTVSTARNGVDVPAFGMADWYNRIHYQTTTLQLGSIASAQEISFFVWNAYLVPKTLTTINTTGDTTGIDLTLPSPVPLEFAPLAQLDFTFTVDLFGPPTVDAVYSFDWAAANDADVRVYGNRITAWAWRPDWIRGVVERLEWKTDVLQAHDGSEQRARLRRYPRRSYEFDFIATGRERRLMEASIWACQARVWAVPVWEDGEVLSADLPAGSTVVPITTAFTDYRSGGLAILHVDGATYEVVEVLAVQANQIELARPTLIDWGANTTTVYPLRTARMQADIRLSRFTGDASYGTARFAITGNNDHAASAADTYRGLPIIKQPSNWVEDVTHQYTRRLAVFDSGTAEPFVDDEPDMPAIIQSHRWLLDGRAQRDAHKALLYALQGRLKALFMPTWSSDLVLASVIQAAEAAMTVVHDNYTNDYNAGVGRRDVRILLRDGSEYYRRITGASEIDAATELLAIDSALGVTVNPEDVACISFVTICRLEADAVEIAHYGSDLSESSLSVRGMRSDL